MAANPIISESTYLTLHSEEIESSIIGAVVTLPRNAEAEGVGDRVVREVKPDAFYSPVNRQIWESVLAVHRAGGYPDLVSVAEHLKSSGTEFQSGDDLKTVLIQAAVAKPLWMNLPYWAGILQEHAAARLIAREIRSAYQQEAPDRILGRIREAVERFRPVDSKRGQPISLGDLGVAESERMDEADGQVRFPCLTTGLRLLDRAITGWRPGTLNVVAAGTSVGKSSAALAAILGQAKAGIKTVLYTYEMSPSACYWRLVSMTARVNARRLRAGLLDREEFAAVQRAQDDLHAYRDLIRFVDAGGMTIQELKMNLCRDAEGGAGCLYVDHAGLIVAEGKSRYEQTSLIADELRSLKSRFDVPLVVLMQINRLAKTEKREPQLHDLRDSGKWEENADTISMLHRPTASDALEPGQTYEPLFWHIAKEREGPTGKIEFAYLRNYALISEGV